MSTKSSTTTPAGEILPEFDHMDIDIPYDAYTLKNGLRLVVHEDHKAPIVAINIWYHVGSKNEKPGKSGLAHLFEHLMFNGSEHFNDDYFQALLAIGATDMNGTTGNDRTNYFQNVPGAALDQVLWLESDRMGHLLGALDQDKLDEQRGVVQNEKRQRENVPYGKEHELVTEEMFPVGHPYSWTVIGSMADLDGTTVEDCHDWFKRYYGAANAVLVVAGDVDAEDVFNRVQLYFGDIPPGPPIVRPEVNIPVRQTDTRASYQDRVPEPRVMMVWNTPQLGTREDAILSLAAAVLSQGKTSRLYKTLVYEQRLATVVSAEQWSREICGNFVISANARPGESIAQIEALINAELEKLLADGPAEAELKRIRARYFADSLKGLERIGGFGGKSDVLASSTVYGDSPDAYKQYHQFIADATPDEIREVCRKWLGKGRFTLTCDPMPEYQVSGVDADRSRMPGLTDVKAGGFPEIERATLSNGLEILLAHRPDVPTVVLRLLIHGGYADDKDQPGLATLAMGMLDEGTTSMSALEINEQLQLLGASFHSGAGLDHSVVGMSTLKQSLSPSFRLFADIILNPSFPEHELERLRKEQYVAIQREKVTPLSMALRVVPRLLYGEGHRYAQPLTGSGFEETIAGITRDSVLDFHRKWITPNNTRLLVVGDLTMAEVETLVGTTLGEWRKGAPPTRIEAPEVHRNAGNLYFLDRPGSLQSIVIGAYLVESYDVQTSIATELMNDVLGGQFTSRINMNLREDKHWTYGARSMILHTEAERPLIVYASVQMDKTLEAIEEIRKEFTALVSDQPVSEGEFEKNRKNTILGLPGKWETNAAVAESMLALLKLNLPDNYFQTYPDQLRGVTLNQVQKVAKQLLDPKALSWFVVGDRNEVLPTLKTGKFASVTELDIHAMVKTQQV